ncbi:hypothetical protein ID866_3036 [Astraeus odoratus]|nr:hypothetical protein ID866_3036 [Astraeus odoratus]
MHNHNGDAAHSFSQPGIYLLYISPLLTARPPHTSSQGLVLPTQSVQNHIHELAKSLPPPRKQNTACDACRHSPVENGIFPWSRSMWGVPWGSRITSHAAHLFQTSTPNLLYHLFSPPESGAADSIFLFGPHKSRSSAYATWGEVAIKLEDENYRAEFALDLVEVYFQIVHTRLPLLNPLQFRSRLSLHSGGQRPVLGNKQEDPLHPALIATVLAWGAKFSEHPLLAADRQRNNGQSLLAKALIDRCRELAESMKVHRIPHVDHVVIALLIEPLQCQDPAAETGFHGFWLGCGIRNLLGLQINHKSVMADIKDPDTRGTMIFAWWMACLADANVNHDRGIPPVAAVAAVPPALRDDDDYDIDFYTADADSAKPSTREQLEFLGYYNAAHALARISRQIARQLWRPQTDAEGIPLDFVIQYTKELVNWRDAHLSKVGVPSTLAPDWDFVTAVSACASDAQYHVMWITWFNALDDYGIREESLSPEEKSQMEAAKSKVFEEALHASLRVSALAGVLATNGYLKLDTAVMHVSIIQAGTFLARLGRPEVNNCINGLLQYSYAYEETREKAHSIQREYEQVLVKGPNFNAMSSAIPRVSPTRAHPDRPMTGETKVNGRGYHTNGTLHHVHSSTENYMET